MPASGIPPSGAVLAAARASATGLYAVPGVADSAHDRFDEERIALLYQGSQGNLTQGFGVFIVLLLFLGREISALPLIGFGVAAIALYALRMLVAGRYLATRHARHESRAAPASAVQVLTGIRTSSPMRTPASTWENLYAAGALATGLMWGGLLLWVSITPDGLSNVLIVVTELMAAGVAITAIAALGSSPRSYLAFASPMILVQAWVLLTLRDYTFAFGIALSVVYATGVARIYLGHQRSLWRHLKESLTHRALLLDQQALFGNSMVGIAHVKNRFVLRANARFFEMFGHTPETLLGQSYHKLFAFDAQKRALDGMLDDAISQGQSFSHEEALRRADNDLIWCALQGRRYDPDDASEGAILILTDVTPIKDAEEALKARELIYRTLVETSPSLIWSIDMQGNVTFANEKGAQAVFGVSADEVIGKNWVDFFPEHSRKVDWAAFRVLIEGRALLDYETTLIGAGGAELEVLVNAMPIKAANGTLSGANGSLINITARRQRENILETLNRDLAETREMALTALEYLPHGFAMWDTHDLLVLCNERFAQLVSGNSTIDPLLGRSFNDVLGVAEPSDPPTRPPGSRRPVNGIPHIVTLANGQQLQVTETRTPTGVIVSIVGAVKKRATDTSATFHVESRRPLAEDI